MKTDKKKHGKRMTSKQRVELFFARIIERQNLEELYYVTGNRALLPEIEKARERIREVMREMGMKTIKMNGYDNL